MSILVIGGTGFIGRYIVEALIKAEKQFTVLTRHEKNLNRFSQKVPYLIADLLKPEDLDLSPFHQFINCSAELHQENLMQALHVDSLSFLLNKIKSIPNAHWLQISSVGVYGKIQSGAVREDYPFAPRGPYEVTKAQAELFIKHYCLKNKIYYTIIRPSNVFGCGMSNQSLLQLISMIRKKWFFYIGKKSAAATMNYVAAQDVAHLVLCCLNQKAALNQDFIVSDQLLLPEFVSIITKELNVNNSFYQLPEGLVRALASLSTWYQRFPISASRVDALTSNVTYSTEKAKSYLNYVPVQGIANGLKTYTASLGVRDD